MSYTQHIQSSKQIVVRCAIVTLSDTRTLATDTSGKKIVELLDMAGHSLMDHRVLKDEPAELSSALTELLARDDVDAILTTGGTGISQRDQTVGVIEKILDQPLPGFGELFRQLSYAQIGSGAMLSRATGGIARGKLIFAMPGSTAAVDLAMTKLILPELGHLVSILSEGVPTVV
jgi:molybdenum cofactor biosynthesis protein B